MRYLIIIIILIYSLKLVGQADSSLNNLLLDLEEEEEFHCDSKITIEKFGDIESKLIFKQTGFDINNKNLIVIPHSRLCKSDHSIIFSDDSRLNKTILKLDYDTCHVADFKKEDNKREYVEFVTPPDTTGLENWSVKIDFLESHCLDTDYHFVRVSKSKTDYIEFSCLHNIQVFELDLNKDSLTEIYLISYIWCASEIRIFRIDKK